MNDLIFLISERFEADEIGNDISAKTEIAVWAEINSVSQSEFSTAAQNGLKPEYKIRMWYNEYDGSKLIKIDGKRYRVYRTYKASDLIELYVEEDLTDEQH